ncbi:hypothetical protein GGI25_005364 [Coemansia spiralis]|uniref:Uncharacterized protein n=2 Tax=Coemansia TaxID=4863 RepID=A0A9W8G2F1_9FUNG|nr:hypothetical protein EDC05_005338 [Coemansia umbellata]KAJ2619678.1 hypothetical protein GGI26_005630 [Coemansia sp. RSA 1358]KAJ2671813.1 hypothetical protein GGI25_005364 [Coemansia spiralis]
MSSADTLAVLNSLAKRKVSKRERSTRSKQFISTCVRRTGNKATEATETKYVEKVKPRKSDADIVRTKNAVVLRAADKLITQKCKDLHRDVIELLSARKEHRKPKMSRKKKPKLTYFDFEDRE